MKVGNHDDSKRFTEVLNINLINLSLLEKKSTEMRFVVIKSHKGQHRQLCIKILHLVVEIT